MEKTNLNCKTDNRRKQIRESGQLNGIDFIEVSTDQKILTVYLLRKASQKLIEAFADEARARKQVEISGGRRINEIIVVLVKLIVDPSSSKDDILKIYVEESGDFSTHTLSLIQLDEKLHPTGEPLDGIDPRYDHIDFSFKCSIK